LILLTQTYLARFVLERALPPEPVATGLLAHVLQQSAHARGAIDRWLDSLVPGIPAGLAWSPEVAEADGGRPDLVGSDSDGPRVIIEGKFDADFQSAQLDGTYLARLGGSTPSLYVVLAPEARCGALFRELVAAHGAIPTEQGDTLLTQVPDGPHLAAVSWQDTVSRLRAAALEPGPASDVDQLDGLIRLMAQSEWLPLGPDDLSQRAGRQISSLITAVVDVAGRFRARGMRVTNATGDQSAGRWITSYDDVQVWLGMWFAQWARVGASPIWIEVKEQPGLPLGAIRSALYPVAAGEIEVGPSGGLTVAVPLRRGVGREAVVESIDEFTAAVFAALQSAKASAH
jgi:hypothetical protein